ncbi:hypothetical protein DL93DRAFT_2082155 [Clavulina sp. PMI_390]|nr:hypothetical protein DL93DRAFT_2082155 [Clavulina sp. PMI_390]
MWKAFRDRDGGEMIVGNGGVTIALVSGLTRRGLRNVNQEHRILALKGLNTDLPDKDFLSPSDRQDIATASDITATFTALHEPAEMASHHNLNSVARANFLVGEVDTALKAFKCLLDRREIPDAHDLAVMVSGIAAFDVELADSALQNATSRGVVMPVQAWTAVLKAAFEGGNLKQADSVLRRMTEAGVKSDLGVIDVILRYGLSEETWGSMLKIEHTTKLSTRKKPRAEAVIPYLEMATRVLLKEQHYPRELTVMCINWVIKCDLPRQAFSFWFEMWKKFDGRPTSPMLKKRSAMDRCMNNMARALVSKYLAGKADYTYAQGRDMCSRLGCRSYWDQKVRGPLGDEPKQSITSQ